MANSATNNNPWKGLNFYQEGEILYGRDSEIESLSQYIMNNSQTVLYGKSGIGKSSILNAGIFPIARQHHLLPVGIRLDHSSQLSYTKQIHHAIVSSGVTVHEIVSVISEDNETLWEYLHRNIFFNQAGQRMQLLLVFDQFEEIFTLQHSEQKKRAFFSELADLLNEITPLYIVNADNGIKKERLHKVKEVEGSLDDMDIEIDMNDVTKEVSNRYLQRVDYHIVFTLREDFLSYLERYTAFIPVMKTNRYALLPINEEQAAEIIMKPQQGLVDKDVAALIIRKVTGRTDFRLDGIPEIEVDAAVLSLYMSRLYIKKGGNTPTISAELVNQFSDDIIKDFYEESVVGLPDVVIDRIEDELLTYDNRRNNVSLNDLVETGIPKMTIDVLSYEKKVLRQFVYDEDIRVELVHDILCPIVAKRLNLREQAKILAVQRKRQKRRIWMLAGLSVVVLGLLTWFGVSQLIRYVDGTTRQGYIVVQEDSTISLSEYWKASITLTVGSDTLLDDVIDKINPSCVFSYNPKYKGKPELKVDFIVGAYRIEIPEIRLVDEDNLMFVLPMSSLDERIPVIGKVISNMGDGLPLFNALVIIGEQVAKTDEAGRFMIYVDKSAYDMEKKIIIIKKDYEYYEGAIHDSEKSYKLLFKGDNTFRQEAEFIDSLVDATSSAYRLEGKVFSFVRKDTVSGDACMNFCIMNDSVLGYLYYIKTYKRVSLKYNSYFLIRGTFNQEDSTMQCSFYDSASNTTYMKGMFKGTDALEGSFYLLNKTIGSFVLTGKTASDM